MNWKKYAVAVLLFALLGVVTLFIIELLQGVLPFNPQHLPGVSPALAFNTSISLIPTQTAELRRRDDDDVFHADGRPDRAQLPFRRSRNRSIDGGNKRIYQTYRTNHRQLLGGHDAERALYIDTISTGTVNRPDVAGRGTNPE